VAVPGVESGILHSITGFATFYRELRPLESPEVPRLVDAKMQHPSANKNEEKQHLIVQRLLSRLDGRLPNSSSLRSRSAGVRLTSKHTARPEGPGAPRHTRPHPALSISIANMNGSQRDAI
jgi:hypothetical protein